MGLCCVSKLILDKHLIPFLGKTPIDSITSLQMEKYKAQKSNEGLKNEAPRSKLRGIKAELRRSQPAFTRRKRLRCARSKELRRGSPRHSSL
jgi:hypothetical protein